MGILEDLRDGKPCRWTGVCGEMSAVGGCTCGEAADEIELLRKERDGLREALRYYAKTDYFPTSDGPWGVDSDDFGNIARAALKEGE